MIKSQIERLADDPEGLRLFQQERLILSATERICELMEEKDINRKTLADSLGTSKSFVTQLLDGSRNMTLRTLSDVFLSLGYAVDIQTEPVEDSIRSPINLVLDMEVPWPDEHRSWNADGNDSEIEIEPVELEGIAA